MKLEYYDNSNDSEIKVSSKFFDAGIKDEYIIKLVNGFDMSLSTGIKNVFNSYPDDFDKGINRDPAYIYGPNLPRSVYFGIKVGNLL